MSNEEPVVDDGPLSEEKWKEKNVLHLLKQPADGSNKSMRDALEKNGVSSVFWKINSIRTYFINNFLKENKKLSWRDDIEPHIKENRGVLYEEVLTSAIVNLYKKPSPPLDHKITEDNFDVWFNQLKDLAPKVVICGGTYEIVKDVIRVKNIQVEECKQLSTGMHYFKAIHVFFLDCLHPTLIKKKWNMEYVYFTQSVSELIEKEILGGV